MPAADQYDALRRAFAERLAEICTDKGLPAHGRQTKLAKLFGVTQAAARKWLNGVTYPEMEKLVAIADWADVNINWLLQGAGPKRGNRIDTRALVIDQAVRSLPREMGIDLIDNLRAKLERVGKLTAHEPSPHLRSMLDAYEDELSKKH